MNNGLDKLPGHAYAPGLEPNWIDLLVSWKQTSSVGVVLPGLLLAGVALIVLMRMVAARPRINQRGVRARHLQPAAGVRGAGGERGKDHGADDRRPELRGSSAQRGPATRLGESEA